MFKYTALHRFGWGPQYKDERKFFSAPKTWLSKQLDAPESAFIKGQFENSDAITRYITSLKGKKTEAERKKIGKKLKHSYETEMKARFFHSLTTDTPYVDRLVHFWSNHFSVSSAGKPVIGGIVGAYEREAIRPYVLRKFSDMLIAAVSHPAMLIYLDNVTSFGPNSRLGKNRGKGLNENLAREILELHTLGVNGGYTQNDVIALAKIITGWTVVPPRFGGGGFKYIDLVHEPGRHVLLGKSYPQNGQQQGIQALYDLARHPSTARFVAMKLAKHFVADEPPKTVVSRLEKVFLKTGGDLRALAEEIIVLPEIDKYPLSKVKTPYEMIVSTLRLFGENAKKAEYDKVFKSLALMNHIPFTAPSPAGWPDRAEDWVSPNATLNRVEWCHALSNIIGMKDSPLELAKTSFGKLANQETLTWIERAPSGVEGLALMIASPEWQRR